MTREQEIKGALNILNRVKKRYARGEVEYSKVEMARQCYRIISEPTPEAIKSLRKGVRKDLT